MNGSTTSLSSWRRSGESTPSSSWIERSWISLQRAPAGVVERGAADLVEHGAHHRRDPDELGRAGDLLLRGLASVAAVSLGRRATAGPPRAGRARVPALGSSSTVSSPSGIAPEASQDRRCPEPGLHGFRPVAPADQPLSRVPSRTPGGTPALGALGARPGDVVEAVRLGLAAGLADPALARASAVHDPEHGLGDLARRHDREVGFAQRPLGVLAHDVGVGHARVHGVGGDALRRERRRDAADETDDRVLAEVVDGIGRERDEPGERRRRDDRAAAAALHRADRGARAVDDAVDVHPHDQPVQVVGQRRRCRRDRSRCRRSGTRCRRRRARARTLANAASTSRRLTDVGPMEDAVRPLGDRTAGVLGRGRRRRCGRLRPPALRRRRADARRRAGDERDLAVECCHDRRLGRDHGRMRSSGAGTTCGSLVSRQVCSGRGLVGRVGGGGRAGGRTDRAVSRRFRAASGAGNVCVDRSDRRAARIAEAVREVEAQNPLHSSVFGVWIEGRPLVIGALGEALPRSSGHDRRPVFGQATCTRR